MTKTHAFSASDAPTYQKVDLRVENVNLQISMISKTGSLAPIVFLHGFGSSKEEFNDLAYLPAFRDYGMLAYDAPGCGETKCDNLGKVSMSFLVKTADTLLQHLKIEKFHLMGHSMGGLTALMLASEFPDRVLSFVNIKGNLSPEDCFLSRQVFEFPSDDPLAFFDAFIERARRALSYSNAVYASNLPHKVRPEVVYGILSTMVELSDNTDLMAKFLGLPCPRMFMYGEHNAGLSYLPALRQTTVELAEIPHSGHFPMYSNPPEMFHRIARFLSRVGAENL
ncbi:Alpha/Beta hydrolase protein [Penicillium cf. griseofulvum]|uniref:Alpha/Beta hydrolase protein n=1 Tax=Penicillium cf. griseofulvum TaxID=2972120 RepID=A0A9W9M4A5_9EURO|nr:Alpha/Beta hydrolase protein [Penicillium cf. griseofulvum]KAJ5422810.1 Alpha/Beta hydrolase protein [Penicillium cf. griseofulvum]KAJ5433973.1 Alpha/Beta hydrolase protein [Penicillium cf. griseofulvum]